MLKSQILKPVLEKALRHVKKVKNKFFDQFNVDGL
jgi:hypothetical protein